MIMTVRICASLRRGHFRSAGIARIVYQDRLSDFSAVADRPDLRNSNVERCFNCRAHALVNFGLLWFVGSQIVTRWIRSTRRYPSVVTSRRVVLVLQLV